MTDQSDLSELKTFTDWCHAIDRLPAEAKLTVEVLKGTIELEYLLNWTPGEEITQSNAVVTECVSSACAELGLSDHYQEVSLVNVWEVLPDEVKTDLEAEITERILLAKTELSLCDSREYSYQLTDLRPLAPFAHLTKLKLNGDSEYNERSQLSDISVLATFTNLTDLDLSSNSIADLSPLTALTQLRSLDLSFNQITDLSPLAALTQLQSLGLSFNEVTDLSPFAALTQLQSFGLSNNKLTDRALETIAKLASLRHLNISHNRITDISSLATLPNLIYLVIHNNDITDFSALDRLPNLEIPQPKPQLIIIRRPADLTRLATLTDLTSLELTVDRAIRMEPWFDLTPLSQLTRLMQLKLEGCEAEDMNLLQTLSELTHLKVSSRLYDLHPLSFLRNLIELDIECSESLIDLSPLATLTKLTKLDLTGQSQISDLSPLQGLTELTYLHCWDAKITDITPLASLTKLRYLNLVNNQISDISPLRSLTNLRELYINGNPISDTSPLLNLPNLEYSSVRIQRRTVFAPTHDPATPLTPPPELQQQYQAVLTQPVDRVEATAAVTAMYAALGHATPEIYFFDSPLAGVERRGLEQETQIPREILGSPIVAQLVQSAMPVGSAAWKAGWEMMQFQPGEAIRASLGTQIWQQAAESHLWFLSPKQMVACGSDFDAIKPRAYLTPEDLVEVIGVSRMYAQQENSPMQASHHAAQAAMRQLLVACGWIVPYENVCIVCDRPRHVRLNEENQLHATSEPAIEFADGWHSGYYHQGQLLPPDVAALIRGWHLIGQEDYSAAVSHCQDAIAIFPKQSELLTIRGVALMKMGSPESALAAFEQAIRVDQNDSLAWYNRACLRVEQGQFEQAIVDLKQALELCPELAETAINDEDFDPIRNQIQILNGQKS